MVKHSVYEELFHFEINNFQPYHLDRFSRKVGVEVLGVTQGDFQPTGPGRKIQPFCSQTGKTI